MKIAVIGRGNVGGGLADLWEGAGHELQRIGQEGGDVSEAEAVARSSLGRRGAGTRHVCPSPFARRSRRC